MLKTLYRLVLSGMAVLALMSCSRSDVTGIYLTKFANGVYRLQLIQGGDSHISGQLDEVAINQAGKIEYTDYTVTGIADRGSVSLRSHSSLLQTDLSGSGTIDGNQISLTGTINPGRLSTVVFVRADDEQYQSAVNDLINEVKKAAAAKVVAENEKAFVAKRQAASSGIEQLINKQELFDTEADTHLARWPKTEQIYREITARMASYLNRKHNLAGDSGNEVQRSQINVALDQLSIETDQLHNGVQVLQSEFQANIVPLWKTSEIVMAHCTKGDSAVVISPDVRTACENLSRKKKTFDQKYSAFGAGLAQLEAIYQEERGKQNQIKTASERIE